VVVIVLMVGFVGGSALTQLLSGSRGMRDTIAYYGDKQKITPEDVIIARQELEVLQALQADRILQSQGLTGFFMSELLFSQGRSTPSQLGYVMQAIRQNQFRISDRQLRAVYDRAVVPAYYWLLLRAEARSAGMRMSEEVVGLSLGRIIPQLYPGQTYRGYMGQLVSRYGVPEEQILRIFGDLLGVLQYAQIVCATESVTTAQIRHAASRQGETLDVEFVQLEAKAFGDPNATPTAEEIQAQFDKYKDVYAGQISEPNPYGFGYRLPARVQMDYIAVKLDDVAGIVTEPTDEEAERYYRENRDQQYTRQVQSDPNDPNSLMIPETIPYAEVAEAIRDQLKRRKITTKAEQILADAKNLADAELETLWTDTGSPGESGEPNVADLEQYAGSYDKIAEEVGARHGLTLHSGQTGFLNAVDIQSDDVLGRLSPAGSETAPVWLYQLALSVPALEEDAALLMFGARARLYRTIGPLQNPMLSMGVDVAGQIMAIVRVTRAEKAGPPEGPDVTFSTRTLLLDDAEEADANDSTFSVAEKVAEDVQKLAAWETTGQRANEFVALAKKDGWETAVAEFNKLYGEQAKTEPNDPNLFKLDQLNRLQRIGSDQLQVLAAQTAGNPAGELILSEARVQRRFVEKLYTLVPADVNAVPPMPLVMPFKPNQSFYCLKNLSIDRLDQQQYQMTKGPLLQRVTASETESLAAVYFNPANILKRARFRAARETQPAEEEQPEQSAEDAT
jgi:hypothetical protein